MYVVGMEPRTRYYTNSLVSNRYAITSMIVRENLMEFLLNLNLLINFIHGDEVDEYGYKDGGGKKTKPKIIM
jgi:hypothetical protein